MEAASNGYRQPYSWKDASYHQPYPAQGIASSSAAFPFSIELFLDLYSPPPVHVLEPQLVGVTWE